MEVVREKKHLWNQKFLLKSGYAVLASLVFFSTAGFWLFALNAQNLSMHPWLPAIYTKSISYSAPAQIWIAAATFCLLLAQYIPTKRWLLVLGSVFSVGFISEYFGTSMGIPFGDYEYTSLLGPKIADRVPIVIPLSWFFMGLCSYMITAQLIRKRGFLERALFASALLTVWDFLLDPAMAKLTSYWIWEQEGSYYGTPWVNFGGWFLTGLVIMMISEGFIGKKMANQVPLKWLTGFYVLNWLIPFGMVLAAGYWLAIAYGVGSLVLLGGYAKLRES